MRNSVYFDVTKTFESENHYGYIAPVNNQHVILLGDGTHSVSIKLAHMNGSTPVPFDQEIVLTREQTIEMLKAEGQLDPSKEPAIIGAITTEFPAPQLMIFVKDLTAMTFATLYLDGRFSF